MLPDPGYECESLWCFSDRLASHSFPGLEAMARRGRDVRCVSRIPREEMSSRGVRRRKKGVHSRQLLTAMGRCRLTEGPPQTAGAGPTGPYLPPGKPRGCRSAGLSACGGAGGGLGKDGSCTQRPMLPSRYDSLVL